MFKTFRYFLFCLLFILIGNTAQAGKIKRAYEALSEYNYFKAKELFEKKWKNNKAAASFGLSVIYGRDDNPFHNLDSAHLHITLSASDFSKLEKKERDKISVFGVDSASIENWKDSIDLKAFRRAVKRNTIPEFESYMLGYFDSDFRVAAERIRDSLVYRAVILKNNADAFLSFINDYPNSHLVQSANLKYQDLLFQELIQKNTLQAYQNFVKKYPKHHKLTAVEDSIYLKSIKNKSIDEYGVFIKQNSMNRNVESAWRNIYKLFTAKYSPQIIQDFQKQFPDYPFKEELQQDFNLANELFLPFKQNGVWGFMDKEGRIKVPAQYNFVESFAEGLALVGLNDKVGFIDKLGEVVVPFEFEEAFSFKNGLAIASKGQYFGIINRVNKTVAPFKYDFIEPFYASIALAAKESGYGYLNDSGVELTSFDFSYSTDFSNSFAVVTKGSSMALLDTLLNVIIPFNYSKLSISQDSLVIAKNDTLYGLLNVSGDTILGFNYDRIDDFSESLALIQKGEKYGYANGKGELTIPIMYTYKSPASIWGKFESGYAKYQRNEKFGVINQLGKEVSPPIFENLKNYNTEQFFPVRKKEMWGYANGDLQLKIKYIYNSAEPFLSGYAIAKNDSAFGVIDVNAKWQVQPMYHSIIRVLDSIFIVKSKKLGLVNLNEEIILPLEYDQIEKFSSQLLKLEKEGDVYYFNLLERTFILPKQ